MISLNEGQIDIIKDGKAFIEDNDWKAFLAHLEFQSECFDDNIKVMKFIYFDCGVDFIREIDFIPNGLFAESEYKNLDILNDYDNLRELTWMSFALSKLEVANIPDFITHIDDSTFYKCKNLKEIYIPKSAVYISSSAFDECFNIKRVYIPESKKLQWDTSDLAKDLKEFNKNVEYIYI